MCDSPDEVFQVLTDRQIGVKLAMYYQVGNTTTIISIIIAESNKFALTSYQAITCANPIIVFQAYTIVLENQGQWEHADKLYMQGIKVRLL